MVARQMDDQNIFSLPRPINPDFAASEQPVQVDERRKSYVQKDEGYKQKIEDGRQKAEGDFAEDFSESAEFQSHPVLRVESKSKISRRPWRIF
jgi:hypothetical protein